MPDTQANLYAKQFGRNIMQLAQQKESRLWSKILQKESVTGKSFSQDRIGKWEMSPKLGRLSKTPQSDPNLSRRTAYIKTDSNAVQLDLDDEIRVIADPKHAYTTASAASVGRKMDQNIIDAAFGTAYSGEDGTTVNSFPAGQVIAHGSTGLTFDKVNQTKRKFLDADILDPDGLVFVTSPAGIEDLMTSDKVTNSDYITLEAIQNGDFVGRRWMGFEWVVINLLPIASNIRDCLAFDKMGICGGIPQKGMNTRTSERDDLEYAWQIWYSLSMGVMRLEDERVVKVQIDES